ncbi:hypothetical protein AMJ82_07650 [candidate division TA06 bacterium SM23_40]|nr:MAG: hypothetical protein AMJ82_07650 [candidate division TA06 bacterium SM23_40]
MDLWAFPNQRTHHLVRHLSPKFDEIVVLCCSKVTDRSFVGQLKGLMMRTQVLPLGDATLVRINPFLNHVESLGLTMLGLESPYSERRRGVRRVVSSILSNIGCVAEFAILPSLLLTFLLRARGRFDVCIAEGPWEAALGMILRRMGYLKLLVYDDIDFTPGYHSISRFRRNYRLLMERWSMKSSDLITAVGDLLAELRHKLTGKPVTVVPNGVDLEHFSRAQKKVAHRPTLVYTGNVAGWAGIDLAIEALPLIAERISDIRLLVVGFSSPEYSAVMESLVEKSGVRGHFSYVGQKEYRELPEFLRQSDIGLAVFRPVEVRKYAFSLKVIEYMAAGLPVIVTCGTQSERVVERYRCGEAIDFDPQAFADCAIRMILDRERYHRYVENGIRASREFAWPALVEREYDLIAESYAQRFCSAGNIHRGEVHKPYAA